MDDVVVEVAAAGVFCLSGEKSNTSSTDGYQRLTEERNGRNHDWLIVFVFSFIDRVFNALKRQNWLRVR